MGRTRLSGQKRKYYQDGLEAFSDSVLAIVITIMVLEIKLPHGHEFADLIPLIPVILIYILSFIYIGTYGSQWITGGIYIFVALM